METAPAQGEDARERETPLLGGDAGRTDRPERVSRDDPRPAVDRPSAGDAPDLPEPRPRPEGIPAGPRWWRWWG